MMVSSNSPTVFISYAWESMHHVRWVERLAYDIALSGAGVTLDRWNVAPGDQIAAFMTAAVKRHDFVLVVCTPKYKRKANKGTGGVAFETDQMTSELASKRNHRKFIPILAAGTWKAAAPTWASGKLFVDMRTAEGYRDGVEQLRRAIFSNVPPIGPLATTRVTSSVDQEHSIVKESGVEFAEVPFGGDYILPEVVELQILNVIETTYVKSGRQFYLIYCDIDGLLAINKKYGFEVGDAVMENISHLFSFHLKDHEVYRLINRHQRRGGDQIFGIVGSERVSGGLDKEAVELVKNCISSIESFDWASLHQELFITVTASVFSAPFNLELNVPIGVLIGDMVDLLKKSKTRGGGSLQILDVEDSARRFNELKTEQERKESEARAKLSYGS